MERALEIAYDKLVIGSDLSALAFCHENECPALFKYVLRPYQYNEKENWQRQMQLWDELAYALSLRYFPLSDKIYSFRLEDDNLLKVVTKQNVVCKIKFNELYISDDRDIEGLPSPIGKTDTNNWVIDWFDVNRGMLHSHDVLEDKDSDFVKKVYFYISDRFYKNATKKDLLTVSKISDKDITSDDFDHNIARMKTLRMMFDAGIRGTWDKTNNRHKTLKITSVKRDVHPLGKNIYNGLPANIKILY